MAIEHAETHADHHPGPAQYILIGGILAVVTALEVGIFFLKELSSSLVVGMLLGLSFSKFVLVVGYFMHLRFDDKRFLALFAIPFVIMLSIVIALLAMFLNLTR